jgi:N-formylglutamate amidohydrolase
VHDNINNKKNKNFTPFHDNLDKKLSHTRKASFTMVAVTGSRSMAIHAMPPLLQAFASPALQLIKFSL